MKVVYKIIPLFILSITFLSAEDSLINLENYKSDFVLETFQLEISNYPHAFNPSILKWKNCYLLSFRIIPNEKSPYESQLGLVWLDKEFAPLCEAQILDTQKQNPNIPARAEDGRLIQCGEKVYFVYSNCTEQKLSRGAFRVYVAEISYDGEKFHLQHPEPLLHFEGESALKREKNWVPFDYQGNLFLAYSLYPHLILHPLQGLQSCETISSSADKIGWPFGLLRGGTPALLEGDKYLSFFHSSIKMASIHSDGKLAFHYFIGAYLFDSELPFRITHISADPIIGENFYHGANYKPYWGSVQAIFPCGFLSDEDYIWIAYGRQDHECWIAKLDKKGLMRSLISFKDTL